MVIFMNNKYKVKGDLTEIYATFKGEELAILIDTDDLEKAMLSGLSWFIISSESGNRYACYKKKNKRKIVERGLLHRIIINAALGSIVDHINNNGLDNRKCNLRIVSKKENGQNRTKAKSNSKSGVLGVHWNISHKKWEAGLRVDGKRIHVGFYNSLEEAKEMISLARAKYMSHSPEYLNQNRDYSKLIKTGLEPQGKNKSTLRYVNWSKQRNKWIVQMWVGKQKHYFGAFDDFEEAKKVAIEMKQIYKP